MFNFQAGFVTVGKVGLHYVAAYGLAGLVGYLLHLKGVNTLGLGVFLNLLFAGAISALNKQDPENPVNPTLPS